MVEKIQKIQKKLDAIPEQYNDDFNILREYLTCHPSVNLVSVKLYLGERFGGNHQEFNFAIPHQKLQRFVCDLMPKTLHISCRISDPNDRMPTCTIMHPQNNVFINHPNFVRRYDIRLPDNNPNNGLKAS